MKARNQHRKDNIIVLLLIGIVLFLTLAIAVLRALYGIETSRCVKTSGDFLASVGSYLGGVIGGIGALIAVFITVTQTRGIQFKNQEKEFRHLVINLSAEYIAHIEEVYQQLYRYNDLNKDVRDDKDDIKRAEKKESNDVYFYAVDESRESIISDKREELDIHRKLLFSAHDSLSVLERRERELYHSLYMHLRLHKGTEEIFEALQVLHEHCFKDNQDEKEYLEGWPYIQIEEMEDKVQDYCGS